MPRAAKDLAPPGRSRTAPAGQRERAVKLPVPVMPVLPKLPVPRIAALTVGEIWTNTNRDFFIDAMSSLTATFATTNMPDIWTEWVITHGDCGTTTATSVWPHWVRTCDTATTTGYAEIRERAVARIQARGRVSPQERAQQEAVERLYVEEADRRLEANKAADRRAEILLRSVLSPDQIRDLETRHHFFMRDKHGLLYRIDRGQHGNVKLLDAQQRVVESYCIQPRGGLPDADAMAAQVMLLETDPESFRRIANVSNPYGTLIRFGTQ